MDRGFHMRRHLEIITPESCLEFENTRQDVMRRMREKQKAQEHKTEEPKP